MMAVPPLPDLAVTLLPALPPSPPTAVTFTALAVSPVLPDPAPDADGAPELAAATAIESPPTALLTAWAGGAVNARRLMPPISPASTHSRDLRRISFSPLLPPVGPTKSPTADALVKQSGGEPP